ncbi:hypothetical protein FQN49_003181 [Arthroderma sp. PD_2]|nr:hypothetical protein FQN49_003181 [Arthroderma sp. PD_2]
MTSSEQFHAAAVPKPAPGGAGMGLFATSTICVGRQVCNLPATFSTVLNTERLADTCSNCFSTSPFSANVMADAQLDLKFCSGCRVVKYCHKGCQAENWSAIHKYECAIYKKLHPRILPVNSRAVLRIIKLRNSKKLDALQDMEMFDKLRSHVKEISESNKEQYERIMLCAKAEKEYSETDLDLETIAEYFAKLEINSFSFTTPFGDVMGLCIQPFACLINHSCNPNAVVGFDEGDITIKAIRKIKSDEQIFISYIDNTNPFDIRQKELAERYYFTCNCSKCAEGDKAREDQFLSSGSSPLDTAALKEAEKKALDLLASAKKAKPPAAVKQLKAAMRILHDTKVWPITRQPYAQIRSELISSLLDEEMFWPALRHSAVRYLRVDPVLYPQEWHPIRSHHAYVFAKLVTVLRDELAGKEASNIKHRVDAISIVYPILAKLHKNLKYELPSVAMLFEEDYEAIVAPVREIGYDPSTASAAKAMAPEWKKIERIVDETLGLDG